MEPTESATTLAAMPELLTGQEAAEYLRVTPETLSRLIRNRELAGRKVGREWRVPKAAVAAFIGDVPQPVAVGGGGGVFDPEDIPARGMWQPARGARGVSDEGVSGAA